jgi:hypothetical protein
MDLPIYGCWTNFNYYPWSSLVRPYKGHTFLKHQLFNKPNCKKIRKKSLFWCILSRFILPSEIFEYNGRGFPQLWDIMEEVSLCCGIKQKRFSSIVGCNNAQSRDVWQVFFRCISQCRSFCSFVSQNTGNFLPMYPTLPKESSPLSSATQKVLFHCKIQWEKIIQRKVLFFKF